MARAFGLGAARLLYESRPCSSHLVGREVHPSDLQPVYTGAAREVPK